ncbi:MAG: peptide deformylase [Desulfovermiculus sp.]
MIMDIKTYPHPVLSREAKPVEEITDEVRTLARNMVETMYEKQGIGLAAPQVGHSCCLITVDISGPESRTELNVLLNPQIEHQEGETEFEEGCLSLPEFKSKIKRSAQVIVTGRDLEGRPQRIEAEGLLAICLQHEIDHLRGTLLLDHASRLKRNLYEKKVRKWQGS